jgi:hypothetical protein
VSKKRIVQRRSKSQRQTVKAQPVVRRRQAEPERAERVERVQRSERPAPIAQVFGADGGCTVCRKPVIDHVDNRGQWLGCPGVRTNRAAMILVPLYPNQADRQPRGQLQEDLAQAPEPVESVREARNFRTVSTTVNRPAYEAMRGPRVSYHALYAVNDRRLETVSNSDLAVYRLIRDRYKQGATRSYLLERLHAQDRTGIVDGAVRRLRLEGVLDVKAVR